jgi:hypothetical protein
MARSDAEGREVPDPPERATQSDHDAPSRREDPASTLDQIFIGAISRDLSGLITPRISSDNTPNVDEPAASMPHTSADDSSHHSSPGASGPSSTHYGTRSRNRPAASRPNYAEDFEMDFEKPIHRQRASSSHSPPAQADHSPTAAGSSKGGAWHAVNSSGSSNANGNGVPSSIPGTSTFSANPSVSVPKKRRAAQNASGSQGGLALAVHSSSRRTTQSTKESRSNMFSFERCQNKLKNGKLVADDGTQFAVNGRPPPTIFEDQLTPDRSRLPGLRAAGRPVLSGAHHGIPDARQQQRRRQRPRRHDPGQLGLPPT